MTIWAEREFETGTWNAAQDAFDNAFMAARSPEDMILVYADGDTSGTQKLYAALPDKAMLPLVPGFTPIAEDKVPAQARFLIGHNKTYNRLFGKKV